MNSARNSIEVSIFSLDENGAVKPNALFHRPHDRLHSRCIEYPYAASRIGNPARVLDVGISYADPYWIKWLHGLGVPVHAIDTEEPKFDLASVDFTRQDVRHTSYPDRFFDTIFAVSVIEHIGLSDSDPSGDVEAVRELSRILAPGGRLIMTFPFGKRSGLMSGGDARRYDSNSILLLNEGVVPVELHYYEYQHRNR